MSNVVMWLSELSCEAHRPVQPHSQKIFTGGKYLELGDLFRLVQQ